MELDLELIGRVVERETMRALDLGTWQALVRRVQLSRSTLNRVRIGERVKVERYGKIERALNIPADTLIMVGTHDVAGLREIGAPSDLVEYVSREVKARSADGPESGKSPEKGYNVG